MLAIYKKEMRAYFTSMTGYLFLGLFVFLIAIFFNAVCLSGQSPAFYMVLQYATMIFIILIPTLTMRLFAEEAKQRTDQLLYTAPIKISQIVAGKFFSAITLFTMGILLTAIFPLTLLQFGTLPVAQIISTFVGYMLLGYCFISIGIFISVLTENQLVAAVATFTVVFVLYMLDMFYSMMPAQTSASLTFVIICILGLSFWLYRGTKNIYVAGMFGFASGIAAISVYATSPSLYEGLMHKVLKWFSIQSRFSYFAMGILNVADIFYYITFVVLFLFLTINVIERRRWA